MPFTRNDCLQIGPAMATEVDQPLALGLPSPSSAPNLIMTPTSVSAPKLSPTQSTSSSGGPPSSSKRPPRKSTLTQQQKNQKRQRATQDQLTVLEMEFNKNPTPTAGVREKIAEEINMTERSVQIWFQNRYAPPLPVCHQDVPPRSVAPCYKSAALSHIGLLTWHLIW